MTITVKPDSGYQLDDLTVTDKNGKGWKRPIRATANILLTMPASKVTVTPKIRKNRTAADPKTFVDVENSDWFADAVITLPKGSDERHRQQYVLPRMRPPPAVC